MALALQASGNKSFDPSLAQSVRITVHGAAAKGQVHALLCVLCVAFACFASTSQSSVPCAYPAPTAAAVGYSVDRSIVYHHLFRAGVPSSQKAWCELLLHSV